MLQGRLTRTASVAVAVAMAGACAGADGTERGAIRENVIEPGITAIDDATAQRCIQDASAIRTAIEVYMLTEGDPPPTEAALVEAGYLRSESELWDVTDGVLVATDPACGPTGDATGGAAEIATDDEPAAGAAEQLATMTAERYLERVSAEDIAELGGRDCALEVAEVSIAYGRYTLDRGAEPDRLTRLVDDGYLGALERWIVTDTSLEAVPGTPCQGPLDVVDADAMSAQECESLLRTLEVAIEAYVALTGEHPPDQRVLVEAELLRDALDGYDVVDGAIVAGAGGCDPPPPRLTDDPATCEAEFFRLQIAVETFEADLGRSPASERDLVDNGYLTDSSPLWDVVFGDLVPADGVLCTYPAG